MEIEGLTNAAEQASDLMLKGGELVDLAVIDVGEVNDMAMNEDEPVGLAGIGCGEGNDIAVNDENSSGYVDITGSLVGLTRKTVEDMYELYCSHAHALGFSVRKSTSRFSIHEKGLVIEKYFVCSCAGFKASVNSNSGNLSEGSLCSSSNEKKKKQVGVTRTGCNASLRVKLNSKRFYEVVHHVISHNHALNRMGWIHLHRSERVIIDEKGKAIEDMVCVGMRSTDSFDAGGEQCVGNTMKNHLNFINRLKMEAIEGADAQTVIDMLYQQAAKEEDFYFRVRLDDMSRLCNVFWRDSMMKEDYNIYGDVVVFDTTCRINRYNLICAPFFGINNHRKNVMFGCAFLADEKTASFEWLFEVFKQSMGGKCPVTLFTDQDQAIANGIEKVFPLTRHRLCLRHLHQNAVNQFGQLKRDISFKDAFNKCLSGCVDENEFESCWRSMISKYGLEGSSWFTRLYDLKEKWCTALSKDFFSVGIQSFQKSESTNNAIGFQAKKTTSCTEFFGMFKETVKRWRSIEENDEFQCSRSIPTSVLPLTGLLKHAADVYTLTIFGEFEAEFMRCIGTRSTVVRVDGSMTVYDISSDGDGCCQRVTFDCMSNLISCSCKNFEECNLLCYHCLRVLHMNSVSEIPEHYVANRWSKFAKSEVWDMLNKRIEKSEKSKDCIPWRHEMARKYYNLLLRCQENEGARKIIEDAYNRDLVAVNALTTSLNSMEQCEHSEISSTSTVVLGLACSVTKGRKQKGHFERKKQKTSTDTSNSVASMEFGLRTPNARMF